MNYLEYHLTLDFLSILPISKSKNSTTAMEPIPNRKHRVRAVRCKDLDIPQIRMEIEVLYTVRGLSLKNVVEEVNKAYGLNAT